ncbi:MAG TPA: DUF1959 domain-containing protein [Methanothermococcus okinawensis]|uniref:DUF1959 domain-containing protein n=1 Tax=Methanothermococcus okinawensis TaxID=155863 RepID=A0A832ZJG3_9EURY|nr:DUF1959 domain-containing protein [Methanothermococcus okinawensis]
MEKIERVYYESILKQKYNIIKNRYVMEEVIVPIAKVLELPLEEVIELFVRMYDGADLYESYAFAEQARMACLGRKVDIDLGLCWICDFYGLISKREGDLIRKKVVEDVLLNNVPYKEALKRGRELLLKLLKSRMERYND